MKLLIIIVLSILVICDILKMCVCDENAIYACDYNDRRKRVSNRCETKRDIRVEERFYAIKNIKFWCIAIDNRADIYTGQLFKIDVASGYGLSWLVAQKISINGLQIQFQLNPGINRIVIYAPNRHTPLPAITSLKLANAELCHRGYSYNDVQPDLNQDFDVDERFGGDDYRFLTDCGKKRVITDYTTFCNGVRISTDYFMAQTFKLGTQRYWCLNFEVDVNNPTSHVLTISFGNAAKSITWVIFVNIYLDYLVSFE